ncbi:DUF2442 domain-containing protein [Candidatus Hydrogenedentota bacterium]
MKIYPKIALVVAQPEKRLLVTFENGIRKQYDCKPLLRTETFRPLAEDWLFNCVQADPGGYGVSWNEEIDLSESELWENGRLIEAGIEANH